MWATIRVNLRDTSNCCLVLRDPVTICPLTGSHSFPQALAQYPPEARSHDVIDDKVSGGVEDDEEIAQTNDEIDCARVLS